MLKNNIEKKEKNEKNNKHEKKESVLLHKHSQNFFEISFNKPKKLNSFDYDMTIRTLNHMKTIDENFNEKKIIAYTSNVPKSFSPGGNLSILYEQKKNKEEEKIFTFYDSIIEQNIYSITTNNIIFCIWDGYLMGGGVGFSLNCPIRISTENTIFSMPENSIGLFPDVGTGFLFPRMFNGNISIGLYLGLTGAQVKNIDCVKSGISTHHINSKDIPELINSIKEKSFNIKNFMDLDLIIGDFCIEKFSKENFYFKNLEIINNIFILDSLKNIYMRLDYEINNINSMIYNNRLFEIFRTELISKKIFLDDIVKALNSCSPLSLFIYFEYFKIGKQTEHILPIYRLDRDLFQKMVMDSDFFEGIRSILVDKDKKKNWKYKSLNEINNEEIYRKYFDTIWEFIDLKNYKNDINKSKPKF
jgi:enoyl-CoA hydratase/carnithine racemase